MVDIYEVGAVHRWHEYGDVEALVEALEKLNGRAPGAELVEAIVVALRGGTPHKKSERVAIRNHSIWSAVRQLRKLKEYPTLEHAYHAVGLIFSVSDSTVEDVYKKLNKKWKKRASTKG
jgi:hypothetical protein